MRRKRVRYGSRVIFERYYNCSAVRNGHVVIVGILFICGCERSNYRLNIIHGEARGTAVAKQIDLIGKVRPLLALSAHCLGEVILLKTLLNEILLKLKGVIESL